MHIVELPAPDFDGYYSIQQNDNDSPWVITVYCDGFRHGGQYAKEWEVDETFNELKDAMEWCDKHYEDFLKEELGE